MYYVFQLSFDINSTYQSDIFDKFLEFIDQET